MKYYANKSGHIAIKPSQTLFKKEGAEVDIIDDDHAAILLKAKIIRKKQKSGKSKQDKKSVENKMDNVADNKSDEKDDPKDKSLLQKAKDKLAGK